MIFHFIGSKMLGLLLVEDALARRECKINKKEIDSSIWDTPRITEFHNTEEIIIKGR